MPNEAVEISADITRILNQPIRDWFDTDAGRAQAEALAVWLTDQLRTSAGCDRCGEMREHSHLCPYRLHERPPLKLRPVQAVILWEYHLLRGAVGWIPVGGGKSLITFLAALMIGALRPMLFLPANLVKDTWTKFEVYDRYWKRPNPLPQVLSFSTLTQKKHLRLLFDTDPDCLMGDECDKAKDQTRSTFKRVDRFVRETNQYEHRCASMWLSGSGMRLSLQDDAHFAAWALGPRAPVPLEDKALQDWSMALDEERKVGAGRLRPGALLAFADQFMVPHADPSLPAIGELDRAREGYSRRYAYSPGIIVYDGSECDQPLTIDFVKPPYDAVLEQEFERFRTTQCNVDGMLLADPLARDRYEGQIGWGGCYYWDPPPPAYWRSARYNWNCFVRDEIFESQSRTGHELDTEMAVAQAFPDNEYYLAWRAVKGDYDPEKNTKVRFFSYSVVQFTAQLAADAERAGAPCVIWVKHEAFAQALAALTGWYFFGEMGERIDQYGRSIKDATIENYLRDYVGRQPPTVILSVDSNMRGRNLQAYCNSLNVGWERAAPRAEQRLGRLHRSGQDRPVHDRVILLSTQTILGFQKTLDEAQHVKKLRRLTQKILTAGVDRRVLDEYDSTWRYSLPET